MQRNYTPVEADKLLIDLFRALPDMGRAVVQEPALSEFNAAVEDAQDVLELEPTPATCRALESCLGLMFNLMFDSPLFQQKPLDQRQTVCDCIEIAGQALSIAGGTRKSTPAGKPH